MKKEKVIVLGMKLERWTNKSCMADFGVEDTWATLYDIRSTEKGKGHATELLIEAKKYYEGQRKDFGGSVALNPIMEHIYQKLGIKEYTN